MTRFGWLVMGGGVIAVLAIVLLLWGFARQSAPPLIEEDNRTPVVDYSTLNIHANGEYGFSIQYPVAAQVEDAFPTEGGLSWRANVTLPGALIVRFVTRGGEVRIGASDDARALSTCEDAGPSETELEKETFGNATWSVFTFDELGTEVERRGRSYRTEHEDRCFVIETFEPYGEQESAPTEEPLFMVRGFSFAR